MVVVNGTRDLDSTQALNMLGQRIEEFNKESSNKGGGYFVERAVLTLNLWNIKRARGDQTNSRVFGDKRKATTSNPKQEYGTTLEALSGKFVVVTLNNWTFQSDKGTTINMLEKHINPYLEWYWEVKEKKVQAGWI